MTGAHWEADLAKGAIWVRSGLGPWRVLALAGVLLAAVPGCREDEQNRVLGLEKGVYAGASDTELTEAQRRELRQRGERQRF